MDVERVCEKENEQVSASDSVEVLEETNGNMDNSDVESDVTIISTGTTVLLWDEKSEDEQWWKVREIGRTKIETDMRIQ